MSLVLLVDDAPEVRELNRVFLEMAGHEVIEAENGLDAVLMVERHRPAVIVMDLDMPIMGGLEATRQIKATPATRGTRVLLLSADEQPPDTSADGYLRKPCPPAEVIDAVARLLTEAA